MGAVKALGQIGEDLCVMPKLCWWYILETEAAIEKVGLTGYNLSRLPNFHLHSTSVHVGLRQAGLHFFQLFNQSGLLSLELFTHRLALLELLLDQTRGFPGRLAHRLLLHKLVSGLLGFFLGSLGLLSAGRELSL